MKHLRIERMSNQVLFAETIFSRKHRFSVTKLANLAALS